MFSTGELSAVTKATLAASALLANGVHLVGRSFKYHRPRGIVGAGLEEPNALLQVGTGASTTPNLRATEVQLSDGMVLKSVNCWPSVNHDFAAINSKLTRFLPPGFYYKTFMWPRRMWKTYEGVIRKAAGLGESPRAPDPDKYDRMNAHCDVSDCRGRAGGAHCGAGGGSDGGSGHIGRRRGRVRRESFVFSSNDRWTACPTMD